MRELHVVALSEDGRHVVLATTPDARRGGFRLALDERLQAAVRGDLMTGDPGREPVSVREIQARLRAGESVEDLVRSGGASLARVERFAGPVLSERAQVVEQARKAVLVRGRRGASALPLGETVDLRLSELPSVRPDSVEWTSWKGEDGLWTVEVSWHSRGRTRTAQWRYDVVARTMTAVDPASAALAHVDAETQPADGDGSAQAAAPGRSGPRGKPGRATPAEPRTTTGRPRTSRAARSAHDDSDLAGLLEVATPRARRSTRGGPGSGSGAQAPGPASTGEGTQARPRRSAAAPAAGPARAGAQATTAPRRAAGDPAAAGADGAGLRSPAQPPAHPSVSAPTSARTARGSSAGAPGTTAGGAGTAARRAAVPFGPAAVAAIRRPPVRPPAPQPEPVPSLPPRLIAGEAGLVVPAPGSARRTAAPGRRAQASCAEPLEGAQQDVAPRQDGAPQRPADSTPTASCAPAAADEPQPPGPPSLRVVPAAYEEDEPAADVS